MIKNQKGKNYGNQSGKIRRYPFGLVWTALPCITFFFPSIGHTGICKLK